MSVGKSVPLALVAMALALTTAPSTVSAADGALRDIDGSSIEKGATLHFVGWMRFAFSGNSIQCHITATVEATGPSALDVKQFSVDTNNCTGQGLFAGCKTTSVSVEGLPYAVTVTPTDFEIFSEVAIFYGLSNCVFVGFKTFDMLFETGITLRPLATGSRASTNTSGNLGASASPGEAIAGVEIFGEGEANIDGAAIPLITTGELELTTLERCTYELAFS